MENITTYNCKSTYYNEGIFKKNRVKIVETGFPSWLEEIGNCTKSVPKIGIISEINNIKENVQNSTNILNKVQELSNKYNVPKAYILYVLSGNGEFFERSGKLNFKANITQIGIGIQRSFSWNEDGEKEIKFSRPNGPDIVSLDEDEINEMLNYIDEENKKTIEEIEGQIKKHKEELLIKN